MKVLVVNVCGVKEALFGLGLSYGKTSGTEIEDFDPEDMVEAANKLAYRQGGHNKFLESIVLWLDVAAPRYWWAEFDTYRVGVTKQSESTMHTLTKRQLTQSDFEDFIPHEILYWINSYIFEYNQQNNRFVKEDMFHNIKNSLPEGFLQRRIVCINAKTLQNMHLQRKDHRLYAWCDFFYEIKLALEAIPESEYMGAAGRWVSRWVFGGCESVCESAEG